jgi:25S rRNA (uracil2843-N3)-methyltransferase
MGRDDTTVASLTAKRPVKAKKETYKPKAAAAVIVPEEMVVPKEEQAVVDLFTNAFSPLLTSESLKERIQAVKTHLYNRDYLAAFGELDNLQAYVVRWSPARALCYRWVFMEGACDEITRVFEFGGRKNKKVKNVVSLGAGAGGELVGMIAAVEEINREQDLKEGATDEDKSQLCLKAVDIAGWGPICDRILKTSKETLMSKESIVNVKCEFLQHDVLASDFPADVITHETDLITLLFTTNELYTQSIPKTTAFFGSLRDRTAPGCILLVLESAGSYSTVKLGEDKEYPMGWLLDYTIIGKDEEAAAARSNGWKLLKKEDSKWYRVPVGLKYQLELENMRFLLRVYQRV